jgi:hypothetical protein
MDNAGLLERIAQRDCDIDQVARSVIANPEMLPQLFRGLQARPARIRFGCEKVLRSISEREPAVLYPWFDSFVRLLDSENNILKWGAIITIANLAAVDSRNQFDRIAGKYFAPVRGPALIAAANIIGNAYKIALAKPHLAERIAREVLKVERARYRTPECRNVACGHAIDSLDKFYDLLRARKRVREFVTRQLSSTRAPVRRKAERFLKRHAASAPVLSPGRPAPRR